MLIGDGSKASSQLKIGRHSDLQWTRNAVGKQSRYLFGAPWLVQEKLVLTLRIRPSYDWSSDVREPKPRGIAPPFHNIDRRPRSRAGVLRRVPVRCCVCRAAFSGVRGCCRVEQAAQRQRQQRRPPRSPRDSLAQQVLSGPPPTSPPPLPPTFRPRS